MRIIFFQERVRNSFACFYNISYKHKPCPWKHQRPDCNPRTPFFHIVSATPLPLVYTLVKPNLMLSLFLLKRKKAIKQACIRYVLVILCWVVSLCTECKNSLWLFCKLLFILFVLWLRLFNLCCVLVLSRVFHLFSVKDFYLLYPFTFFLLVTGLFFTLKTTKQPHWKKTECAKALKRYTNRFLGIKSTMRFAPY